MTTSIGRAAEFIERASRGAHTTDGHPMKMSDHTAQIIAEALADEGLLTPDIPEANDAEGHRRRPSPSPLRTFAEQPSRVAKRFE